jgi:glycosyltransferase involved in cell wall biosynthesis
MAISVSVVIPTVNRDAVRAAVMSAVNQTSPPVEIIVVVDSADRSVPAVLEDIPDKVRLLYTGGIGPSGARMLGVAEARGEVVAFLDDDDVWLPEKLERQLALVPTEIERRPHFLLSCSVAAVDHSGRLIRTWPSRIFDGQEKVSSYLFRRSTLAYGEGMLHPSALLCDRALIDVEPWDPAVTRHEDWDWLLRVGQRSDVTIRMCSDVLVKVATGGRSTSAAWRLSLDWFRHRAGQLTPRERGDFLLCHTATSAIRARSRRGGFVAAWEALRCGRPGLKAWLVWALHMLSPAVVDRATMLKSKFMRSNLPIVEHDHRRETEMKEDAVLRPQPADAIPRLGAVIDAPVRSGKVRKSIELSGDRILSSKRDGMLPCLVISQYEIPDIAYFSVAY